MKRPWMIVGITSMALIGAGVVVRAVHHHRQLLKRAAAYRIRAEQGDAKSQLALGGVYYYGKGVPKDYVEAARWYLKSAEQGNVDAQRSVSHMYYAGKGLRKDDSEGARWCRRAADHRSVLSGSHLSP